MPREFPRARRVGEQIHRELMDLLRTEVKDPRVNLVTITGVEVSRDLSYAKVFFTTLDESHERNEVRKVLTRAAGFLRHELGQRLIMRSVPELRFKYDESIERAAHMEDLIRKARARDAGSEGQDE